MITRGKGLAGAGWRGSLRGATVMMRAVDLRDVVGLSGAGLIFAGIWQVHRPSALIVLGALLLALTVWGMVNEQGRAVKK